MKQKTALDILKTGQNVFITGSAGTGKTYLLNQYIQYLKERRIYPTIVAPTGIAASHLNGQTIHSFFSLGIRDTVDNKYINSLIKNKYIKRRFNKVQVLIIDEVSMVSPEIFTSMDRILSSFKDSPEPFGGVQVVISGDFFQLPPVSKKIKAKRFAWQSDAWRELDLQSCYLEEKFRQDDNKLIQVLDEIRSAEVTDITIDILNSRMNKKLSIDFDPTKLYTHNFDVDRINNQELDRLEGDEHLFKYSSKGSSKYIEKIFKTSLVLEELRLKKDAVVIFIKNNIEKDYVNGTTGVIIGFDKENDMPLVKISSGRVIKVEEEDWIIEDDEGQKLATVSQVPLRLAWAITVHKSQGMSLDSAQIDLSKTFEVGQGYVALSRVKNMEGLQLLGLNNMALRVDPLILRIDESIKIASQRAEKKIKSYSIKKLTQLHRNYIRILGGITDIVSKNDNINDLEVICMDNELYIDTDKLDKILKELKSIPKKEKKKKSNIDLTIEKVPKKYIKKIPTHLKTKALIDSCDTIQEIAEMRGLKESTIITHLTKLKELDNNIDLRKFGSSIENFDKIKKDIISLKENRNSDFFYNDKPSITSLFRYFNGEISYNVLRKVILFI
ncbi:MAG: AAA family ATPase [Sulfurovaceae bacterium]|nr:AAA family ATPase [Sulfurovaceae bacterium]